MENNSRPFVFLASLKKPSALQIKRYGRELIWF